MAGGQGARRARPAADADGRRRERRIDGGGADVAGGRWWRGGLRGGSGSQEIQWPTDRAAGEGGEEREKERGEVYSPGEGGK